MEKMFTPEEIAERLQISLYKARAMIRKGTIPGIKVDGQWRVHPEDYQSYLDSLRHQKPESDK